ncbi:mannose-6-phosphate isomerase, class I [Vibrio vulnificus]|uniref:mannose-6-phosphate isomerase, class I n=1 Tax=Vibrio vulnificus TaxID=672 RepID=UPI0019D47A79|nr:mannose-6-phosphate isomerase, class I [Vibrio vulnificus]EJT0553366.1 mannose-6-phosphate isomerase, class I [Vibrio vulnificus]MBN8085151.1 mannose-6-phosphate isomerase, class I [Vibrio vulnificus]MBN8128110.1 mannose-6-phosphate isomerase, class I [Vibrio vulnificus]HAS6153507.1 mannose-6-phosphate isomerase, class I [Vibrio vulnificus]
MNFFKLDNPVKNYEWGSTTAIQSLFGIDNPNGEPQAEIWMGAHPNGCSTVSIDGESVLLSKLIQSNQEGILSKATAEQFGELPYLFKVLAAGQALSIQVHPSKEEAEVGFAREEAQGIDRSAAQRNYRDPNHKPELVYALTPYQAMNGFRAFDDILAHFTHMVGAVHMPTVQVLLEVFKANKTSYGLEAFFTGLLSLQGDDKLQSLAALLEYVKLHQKQDLEDDLCSLVLELAQSYPSDIGLFAPFMLNVLTLKPGQAMYLDARTPHAYLKGAGLEIMANSDNVLRAGLTPKHIDVDELAKCTLFEEKPVESLLCQPETDGDYHHYPVSVPDFNFDCFMQADDTVVQLHSAEILFAIDCDTTLSHKSGEKITITKGESVFIPAYAQEYTLSSKGRVARAYN